MSQSLQLGRCCGATEHVETLPLCQLLLFTIFQEFIAKFTTVCKIECDNFMTDPVVVSKFQLLVKLIELSVAENKVYSVHLKLEFVVV